MTEAQQKVLISCLQSLGFAEGYLRNALHTLSDGEVEIVADRINVIASELKGMIEDEEEN